MWTFKLMITIIITIIAEEEKLYTPVCKTHSKTAKLGFTVIKFHPNENARIFCDRRYSGAVGLCNSNTELLLDLCSTKCNFLQFKGTMHRNGICSRGDMHTIMHEYKE